MEVEQRLPQRVDVVGRGDHSRAGLVDELETVADLVLCEGVMGLFDGTGTEGETGSTAELARMTGWPVVLVVDARGQGASAAALLRGFAAHDRRVPVANARLLYRGLKDHGVPAELLIHQGVGHTPERPRTQRAMQEQTYAWLGRWLWGDETPLRP